MSIFATDLPLDIVWDRASVDEWRKYFLRVDRSNIIQCAPYAYAMRDVKQQLTRFGVISFENVPVGILQIQEIKLLGALHFVFLHRGPLWFGNPEDDAVEAFWNKFNVTFPRRLGRVRRVMPELEDNVKNREMLRRCGFVRKCQGYRSIWIDLSASLEDIRQSLSGKWRNSLNKSLKQNLLILEMPTDVGLDLLLSRYLQDRIEKKYAGASPKMIKSIVKHADDINYPILLNVGLDGTDVAMGLFFVHGRSATYQIGWINDKGRKGNAHNFMLWKAIEILKARGIRYLDLGGINPDSAAGVTKFKQAMGGDIYTLVGTYA